MANKCSYDPKELAGQPIGMLHCPICGQMVVAGMDHPDYSLLDNGEIEELLNIDPDSYVKGVEEGKRNATPSVEKQSEIIALLDRLIENTKKQLGTMEELRTMFLAQGRGE